MPKMKTHKGAAKRFKATGSGKLNWQLVRCDRNGRVVATYGEAQDVTPFFSLGANYRYVWNELDGVEGTSSGFMTRILLMLD